MTAAQLTDRERQGILAARRDSIERPADRPVPLHPGDVVPVHPQVEIEVTNVRRVPGKWLILFMVRDMRPRLLHRNSSHGYTATPAQAMFDEPEAVPVECQRNFSMDAQSKTALLQERARREGEIERLASHLDDARSQGKRGRARNLVTRMRRSVRALEALEAAA